MVCPHEAKAPLIVDANAVLPPTVTRKSFQFVAGWNSKVIQVGGSVQHGELAHRYGLEIYESSDTLTRKQSFRIITIKGNYCHA